MKKQTPSYQRHRFPSEIISHAIWLYHPFFLSFREVEELLAERGITVTYETIRQWSYGQKTRTRYFRGFPLLLVQPLTAIRKNIRTVFKPHIHLFWPLENLSTQRRRSVPILWPTIGGVISPGTKLLTYPYLFKRE